MHKIVKDHSQKTGKDLEIFRTISVESFENSDLRFSKDFNQIHTRSLDPVHKQAPNLAIGRLLERVKLISRTITP